jgi:small neutral amino acid transporter SnatA (MarC family)
MSEHDDNPYHLPLPSAQPLIASLGAATMLVGLVPDARLWRMTVISVGAVILTIGVWLWVSDAVEEYRNLPDE